MIDTNPVYFDKPIQYPGSDGLDYFLIYIVNIPKANILILVNCHSTIISIKESIHIQTNFLRKHISLSYDAKPMLNHKLINSKQPYATINQSHIPLASVLHFSNRTPASSCTFVQTCLDLANHVSKYYKLLCNKIP